MEKPSLSSGRSISKNIEEYSNLKEINSDIEALTHENFILTQTSEVLERYLKKRCPVLLIALDKFLEQISNTRMSLVMGSLSGASGPASITTPHSSIYSSRSFPHSLSAVYSINPTFKIDMVDRELDEGRIIMDKLKRRFESAKFLLQSEEGNLKFDIKLLGETKSTLQHFIKNNTDKKTGRVFYDKFLRFFENELQSYDRDLRKMKLKTKSHQIEYNNMMTQQQQKIELREQLHPVDLDKLLIENQKLLDILEQKTSKLSDLKKTVGKKGQRLVSNKSKLNSILLSLRGIKEGIKQKETKYNFCEKKEIQNVEELITAEIISGNIKRFGTTCKSPDAHAYLMVQVNLDEMKSKKDLWERRCRYQTQNILLLEHQIKQFSSHHRLHSQRPSSRSYRTTRSLFSSKSLESVVRNYKPSSIPIPHCTPTTPTIRRW